MCLESKKLEVVVSNSIKQAEDVFMARAQRDAIGAMQEEGWEGWKGQERGIGDLKIPRSPKKSSYMSINLLSMIID